MFAVFFTTPFYHMLYVCLERHLPTKKRSNAWLHLFVDQIFISPTWLMLYIVASALVVGDTTFHGIQTHFHKDYFKLLKTMWIIYPLIQALNFSVVPLKFRLVLLTIIGFFFSVLLALLFREKNVLADHGHFIWVPVHLKLFGWTVAFNRMSSRPDRGMEQFDWRVNVDRNKNRPKWSYFVVMNWQNDPFRDRLGPLIIIVKFPLHIKVWCEFGTSQGSCTKLR